MFERPDLAVATTVMPNVQYYNYNIGFRVPPFGLRISTLEKHAVKDEDYEATFGTEPTTQTYWDLMLTGSTLAETAVTCNAYIRISYQLECFEPKQFYTD